VIDLIYNTPLSYNLSHSYNLSNAVILASLRAPDKLLLLLFFKLASVSRYDSRQYTAKASCVCGTAGVGEFGELYARSG